MESIIIRRAALQDLNNLLRFEQGLIHAERPFDATLRPEETYYYNLREMIVSPHVELVVAEADGVIAGCGYARMETAQPQFKHEKFSYVGFMFIIPEHRGKGINQKIIDALKQWSLSQGITEMRLTVYVDNVAAIRAYEKAGFKKHLVEMRLSLEKPHE